MSTKKLGDFYSNLCIKIPEKSLAFAVQLAQFCANHIQFGDPRAYFFKDVLPCILQILHKTDHPVNYDGADKSSLEFHKDIINNVLSQPFKPVVLPSVTAMFK